MSLIDTDIITTRLIPFPRETVFAAIADPEQLARWWGPEGFTNTFSEFDFRSGGSWTYVMHGPNGANYPNESQFEEIEPPARLVLVHLRPVHRFVITMTLDEEDGGTRLTWNMRFEIPPDSQKFREFIANANEQNFDRLEAVLAESA